MKRMKRKERKHKKQILINLSSVDLGVSAPPHWGLGVVLRSCEIQGCGDSAMGIGVKLMNEDCLSDCNVCVCV